MSTANIVGLILAAMFAVSVMGMLAFADDVKKDIWNRVKDTPDDELE